MKKKCPTCKKNLPRTTKHWHATKYRKDGLVGECKQCRSIKAKAKYPERKAKLKAYLIKHIYNISFDHFEHLVKLADNKCQICKQQFGTTGKNRPNIDHDHETKFIRGILCQGCNSGIGSLRDSISNLKAAIEYLEKAETRILEKSAKCL